ncbi:MAG: anaerobic nitric oxide reductase flavorubredoxin [Prevotella sp.]|nr:anaerobic nitric oxide reductase flavorubredoxin [Massilibacteroides sp.]MDD2601500.1 anaerobic nitric oxide reductase flavorubredoxin [Prevotella sp.]MDD4532976.1 anaerobic nitric oxide reductase flavorubredoxin [Prevotella sp.]MDT3386305.1 anaerobic nitric oxide reductase flavorubredoxin [Bacteroidota bacterium]
MKKIITNNVNWVGINDWELRQFHGQEYSTHKGSTYNSYLIQEEKNVLVDTVFVPFAKKYVANLGKVIDLKKIDYVIMNHAEPDHSGALPELMSLIPDTPIYCTENAVKSIKGHYHQDWNFVTVKAGDRISIGNGKELIFVPAPMLHWPDSMFTYLTGDNILFSNDAFGQHYCSDLLFNDLVDQSELHEEAIKYYANILTPFSKFVTKKIDEVVKLNLPIDYICTSHGVVWRNDPLQIVKKYAEWADNYQENQVTLIYDTMYNGTRTIAENIAKGISQVDPTINIKLYNAAKNDKNDLITEVFKSKAILVGSPTVNNGIMHATAGLLEMIKGLKFVGKKAAAFSCYGWNDKSSKEIDAQLREAGFDVILDPITNNWEPDGNKIEESFQYGKKFASLL